MIVENAIGRIQGMMSDAADTLQRNLTCENPAVETRAAAFITETGIKGREQTEILERLEALENATTQQ